jgi:hypothetical protein
LINSAEGRVKDRNMRARPDIAITIMDPDNHYRYIQIRGRVVEITKEGAVEHIDRLSSKYTGNQRYAGHNPDEQRVTYKILPVKISASG